MKNNNECGCGCHSHHGVSRESHHSEGDGCSSGYTHRRFYSKEETINQLQEYLQQLQSEVKGVEEYLSELKKSK